MTRTTRRSMLRAFVVTSFRREKVLPDTPTLAEAGFADLAYEGCGVWTAQRMADLGLAALNESPQRFADLIAAEIPRNRALVTAARIQPE